jgi:hypothetical protein
LAARAGTAAAGRPEAVASCGAPNDLAVRLAQIGAASTERECVCASAAVEAERWACAGEGDDKSALQARFDKAAAACEGR